MASPPGLEPATRQLLGPDVLPGHLELIEAALSGRDALGVLPADAARWSLGALLSLFARGPVLLVTQLTRLARDREAAFRSQLVAARQTLSQTSPDAVALLGNAPPVTFLTPDELGPAPSGRGAALVVIEDAHSASQWGHDFRTDYLSLRPFTEAAVRPALLALTGAATRTTEQDVVRRLALRSPRLVRGSCQRSNVRLSVTKVRAEEKLPRVLELLRSQPGSGFVVAASADAAVRAWTELVRSDVAAALFHADLDPAARDAAAAAFAAGRARVMVTVGSLGLLLGKIDARFVVHWDVPDSLESYADQLGCAGRDGAPAVALLLYQRTDAAMHRLMMGRRYPVRGEVERALSRIFADRGAVFAAADAAPELSASKAIVLCHELARLGVLDPEPPGFRRRSADPGAGLAALRHFDELRTHDERRLEQMLDLAEQGRCRWRTLLHYFGQRAPERCDNCDVCARPLPGRRGRHGLA